MVILFANNIFSQDILSEEFKRNLNEITSKEILLYTLDLEENKKIFEKIETFANSIEGFELEKKDLYNLKFRKENKIISKEELPKEKVKDICSKHINDNKLIKETKTDKIYQEKVYSRVRETIDSINPKKEIVLQRLIIKRSVNNYEVTNSKFIIDISPKTEEILSIKSMYWTPINEIKPLKYEKKDIKKLLNEIDSTLRKISYKFDIEKSEICYTQSRKYLIPALRISVKPEQEEKNIPIIENHIFLLINDYETFEIIEKQKKLNPKTENN